MELVIDDVDEDLTCCSALHKARFHTGFDLVGLVLWQNKRLAGKHLLQTNVTFKPLPLATVYCSRGLRPLLKLKTVTVGMYFYHYLLSKDGSRIVNSTASWKINRQTPTTVFLTFKLSISEEKHWTNRSVEPPPTRTGSLLICPYTQVTSTRCMACMKKRHTCDGTAVYLSLPNIAISIIKFVIG